MPPYSRERMVQSSVQCVMVIKMTAFDKAWAIVKEDECEGDCNGCEYHPDKCNCRGCTDGGSKGDWCWRAGRPVDGEGNIEFDNEDTTPFKKSWGVVKNENEVPIDECKGCGLAHGSPNSEYCSEICERQNKVEKSEYKGENQPTNPSLWSQAKSKDRSKFKVYPSAYANGWAAKWYKSKGGGWKKKGKAEKK